MPRRQIPSLYFTKGGSAASWCVTTESELRALAAEIAALGYIEEEYSEGTAFREEEEEEEDVSPPPSPGNSTWGFGTISIDALQEILDENHGCICACHGSQPHAPHHDVHEPADVTTPTAWDMGPAPTQRPITIVSLPNDNDGDSFLAPRRAPAPPHPRSSASSTLRTPTLSMHSSSDSCSGSIMTARSERSFLRSWSQRISSGWWRTSIASVNSFQSTSSASSFRPAKRVSKPLPALPEEAIYGLPAQSVPNLPTLHAARRVPNVPSPISLVPTPVDERAEDLLSAALSSRRRVLYSARPPSSQIGVAF